MGAVYGNRMSKFEKVVSTQPKTVGHVLKRQSVNGSGDYVSQPTCRSIPTFPAIILAVRVGWRPEAILPKPFRQQAQRHMGDFLDGVALDKVSGELLLERFET